MDALVEKLNPIIRTCSRSRGTMYRNILIPVSDGRKQMNLSVDLGRPTTPRAAKSPRPLTKNIILYQIDEHWKQHLRDMDDLKQSVQNASYEQKDPIVVYKLESYNLFAQMLETLNKDVLSFLFKAFFPLRDRNEAPPEACKAGT